MNEEVIHDLALLPEVTQFVNSSTKETLQLQGEPQYTTKALGDLYSDRLVDLIYGALLSEKRAEESTEEFLERFDDIWRETEHKVRERIRKTQISFDVRRSFRELQRDLLDKIDLYLNDSLHKLGMKIYIPLDDFVTWVVTYDWSQEVVHLPDVIDPAFGISIEESIPQRASEYWKSLCTAATDQNVTPPDGDTWSFFDFKNPSERDYRQYETALSALDDELTTATNRYWEEKQIIEQDKLLVMGLMAHSRLLEADKEILRRSSRRNTDEGWSRYDTRRANVLATERDPPLLSREVVQKRGTDQKKYELTEFGQFVRWLTEFVASKDGLSVVTSDFLQEVPPDVVESAIGEVNLPELYHWMDVISEYEI